MTGEDRQAIGLPGVAMDVETMAGACHCGAVRFTVRLTGGLHAARRCNCSYCRMRGAVALTAALDCLRIDAGQEVLTEYRFNTGKARHFFCARCGIYTHHLRRSNSQEYGVNAACLAGVSPFDFAWLTVTEGHFHPSDGGGGVAGWLRFTPAD